MCVYRGAVQSNAGQEDSILSPRDERESDGREREMRRGRARGEEGWLGAAARIGMATYSHGAKTIASRAAAANRRTRSAAAVSARSTSHFDWGLGSTASACASRTRNRGDSGARKGGMPLLSLSSHRPMQCDCAAARPEAFAVPPFHDSAHLSALCRLQYRHISHLGSG